jgi:hypothetical protein
MAILVSEGFENQFDLSEGRTENGLFRRSEDSRQAQAAARLFKQELYLDEAQRACKCRR